MKYTIIIIFVLAVFIYYYFNSNEKFTNFKFLLDDEIQQDKAVVKDISKYVVSKKHNMKALRFNGKTSFVKIEKLELENFTISLFFKVLENKNQPLIYSKSGNWSIDLSGKNCRAILDREMIISDQLIENNTWYNLAVSINSGGLKIHINGIENNKALSYNKKTKEIFIGSNKNQELHFNGYIGRIKVFKRNLGKDELCHLSKLCKVLVEDESDDGKCNFIPKGLTLKDCLTSCSGNKKCDYDYCQNVCKNCIDYENCKWIERPIIKDIITKKVQKHDVPYAPEIRAIPMDKKISLEWAKPYDGGTPITDYLIMIHDSFNPEVGVKLSLSSDSECEQCNHIVSGLKNGVYYDVSVRAINNIGLGKISNQETISPNGLVEPNQVSNSLFETDEQLKKELMVSKRGCVNKNFENKNSHILDNYESLPNFFERIQKNNISN